MSNAKFATVINCMDGRTQIQVNKWICDTFNVDYVDTITEPGPVKILADNTNNSLINSIKNRIDISIHKHKSNIIIIVAHYDCAGNPVDKETQCSQMQEAVKNIESWGYNAKINAIWVDNNWQVNSL